MSKGRRSRHWNKPKHGKRELSNVQLTVLNSQVRALGGRYGGTWVRHDVTGRERVVTDVIADERGGIFFELDGEVRISRAGFLRNWSIAVPS